jgi:putative endonuclease
MEKSPAVYILTNQFRGTLYVGVTSDLVKRIWEHKNNHYKGFSEKFHTHTLVYFELHENMESAIYREKQIKKWNRAWKFELIEKENPYWKDLWFKLV